MTTEGHEIRMIPAGEILPNSFVNQVFVATDNYLSGLSLLLATFARKNSCHVDLRLYRILNGIDNTGLANIILRDALYLERRIRVVASCLYDNDMFDFVFDPIETSKGVTFIVSLTSDDSFSGNAITVWTKDGYGCDLGLKHSFIKTDDRGEIASSSLIVAPRYAPPLEQSKVPRGVLFSPVTQCNYNCIHCISKHTRRSFSKLSAHVCKALKRYAATGELERLATDYSGDLLFADEKHGDWLDFVIQLGIPFHVDTNGSHLSQERITKLIGSRVESINVSLDSATPETFQRIRRGPVGLMQILENAKNLVMSIAACGRKDVKVSFGFTLMRSNIHELIRLIEIANDIGVKTIQTRHLEAYEEKLYPESMIHDQLSYNFWRSCALEASTYFGVTVHLPEAFSDVQDALGHRHCREPWFSAVILGNDDVMACCVPGTKMGNLSEQSLEDIWNGVAYQELRNRVNSPNAPGICKSCPIYRLPQNKSSYLQARQAPADLQNKSWLKELSGN